MENIIEVKNIKRYYKIAKEEKGFWASLKSLVNKKYEIKYLPTFISQFNNILYYILCYRI